MGGLSILYDYHDLSKIESFIRSKYESRRWALDTPPPSDPTVLEGGSSTEVTSEPSPTHISGLSSVRTNQQNHPTRQPAVPAVTPVSTTRHSQPHQLLSVQYARGQVTTQSMPTQGTPTPAPAPAPTPENDLFSLDFHAPPVNATATTAPTPRKDAKQDILSLFNAQAAPSPWSQAQAPAAQLQSQPLPPFSNTTTTSSTNWNVGHNWNNPVPPVQPNVWGPISPTPQPALLSSGSDIWGGSTSNPAGTTLALVSPTTSNTQTKKDDVFGDIWGSFK